MDKEKEINIFKTMHTKTINLKEKFIPYVESLAKENDQLFILFSENDVFNIMKVLLFGVDENTSIKKVDLVKNKNLLKKVFLNLSNFYNSLIFLKDIFVQIDEFIWFIDKFYYDEIYKNSKEMSLLNEIEISRFMNVLDSFKDETSYIRSSLSSLKEIVHNSCVINSMNELDFQDRHDKIKKLKKESLKRYYFYDIYDIKDGIKHFYTDDMFFGESNNIMHMYNHIIDFMFKDFCSIYNTIENNLNTIIKTSTK